MNIAQDKAIASRRDSLAFDRQSVRSTDVDGHMHVEIANISKAVVNPYNGAEIPDFEELGLDQDKVYKLLRDPQELAKAAPSFNGKPLLFEHKPIDSTDHAYDITVGSVSNVTFEDPYLKATLVIWPGDAIDAITSNKQKELSCGYRYRADMTPGVFQGEKYDGVMRDIIGNHVALVKEGRAGPDVVIGDSAITYLKENNMPKVLSRKAVVAQGALTAYLMPKLAKDAKIDLTPIVASVTSANYVARKPAIIADIKRKVVGKLAQDANFDLGALAKILDVLDGVNPDEPMPEPNVGEKAEPSAAEPDKDMEMDELDVDPNLPPLAKKEETTMDDEEDVADLAPEQHDDPMTKVMEFLKGKLSDEDMASLQAIAGSEAKDSAPSDMGAGGEFDDFAGTGSVSASGGGGGSTAPSVPETGGSEAAARPGMDEEDDEMKKKNCPATDEDEDDSKKKDFEKMTKPAMDAAVNAAVDKAIKNQQAIREAERHVRPWIGEVLIAHDSAASVYRTALKHVGAKSVDKMVGVPASALQALLEAYPKPGARPVMKVAQDSASAAGFFTRFPDAARIGLI